MIKKMEDFGFWMCLQGKNSYSYLSMLINSYHPIFELKETFFWLWEQVEQTLLQPTKAASSFRLALWFSKDDFTLGISGAMKLQSASY